MSSFYRIIFSFFGFVFTHTGTVAQSTADSLLAIEYFYKADSLYENIDSCIHYSFLALPLLESTNQWDKYVSVLCGLNYCYNTREQYDLMEINNLKAFEIARECLSPETETYLSALNNYALVFSEIKEDYSAALKIYKEAEKIFIKATEITKSTQAGIATNIGQMYFELGDFDTAVKYYEEAKKRYSNVYYKGRLQVPNIMLSKVYAKLSNLFYAVGKFERAEQNYIACISTLNRASTYDANIKIRFSLAYAKILIAVKKADKALRWLEMLETQFELTPIQKLKLFNFQGLALLQKKQFDKAEEKFQEGLKQKIFKDKYLFRVQLYLNFSGLYSQNQAHKKSLEQLHEAIKLLSLDRYERIDEQLDIILPLSTTLVKSELTLFKVLKKQGLILSQLFYQTKEEKYANSALKTFSYLSILSDRLRSHYRSKESELFLLENTKDFYDNAVSVAFDLYEMSGKDKYFEKAFYFAEKSKSNLLLNEIAKTDFWSQVLSEEEIKEEYRLRTDINYCKKRLRTEKDTSERIDLQKELADLESRLIMLTDEMKAKLEKHPSLVKPEIVSVKEVQENLSKKQVLLEYFVGEKELFVFKITQDETKMYKVGEGFDLNLNIEQLFDNLKMPGGADDYRKVAYAIYSELVAKAELPEAANDLLIIPDGLLENLPFDILISDAEGSSLKLPYLLYDYACSYAYSATVYVHQQKQTPAKNSHLLKVFPVFEDTYRSLEGSKNVHSFLNKYEGRSMFKNDATVQAFKENLNEADLIHLSTHARGFDKDFEEPSIDFIDSTLLLSDLRNYKIPAHLVVLSACESGVGTYRYGEGVMSLSRAFAYAGVPSLITDVYKVSDRSTGHIMVNLYESLEEGLPKHEALRQAKLRYLQSASDVKKSPYYWGTFLIIGNTDDISLKKKYFYNRTCLILSIFCLMAIVSSLLYALPIVRSAQKN